VHVNVNSHNKNIQNKTINKKENTVRKKPANNKSGSVNNIKPVQKNKDVASDKRKKPNSDNK